MSLDLNGFVNLPESEQARVINALSEEEFDQLVGYKEWLDRAVRAKEDLISYCCHTMPDPEAPQDGRRSRYQTAPHHRIMAEALEEVMTGKCLRLIIMLGPQFGKSEVGTRRFLSQHMGRFPWKHVICTAYNSNLAEEFGEDVRAIVTNETARMIFPRLALRGGSKAKDHMVTEEGGKYAFSGLRGTLAGRPADGLLIDDPIKNAKEAESLTFRDDVWNAYTRVANARCHSLTWQIIISTRWHEDDLIGRLTDPKNAHYKPEIAKQWKVINLSAIVDDPVIAEILGKKVGDALWPERFPIEHLRTAQSLDPYGFNALYMGRPTPPEGAFYKDWMLSTYDSPVDMPKKGNYYLTGDLAVSPDKNADKSCVGIWILDSDGTLWLHPELYWDRKSSDESVERIIYLGSSYAAQEAYFEKGQLDKAIGPFLENRHMELMREGKGTSPDGTAYRPQYFTIKRLPVAGSKGLRSVSIRGLMSMKKVRFPSFAPWWPAAKEQMLKFTGSGNDASDDFCDMVALIGQALADQVKPSAEKDEAKVVPFRPTFGWMTAAHRDQKAREKAVANLRGM